MSDPGPHARFPYGPALLCAASLTMAAWTWMRYSYRWELDAASAVRLIEARRDAWVEAVLRREARSLGETVAHLSSSLRGWPAEAYVKIEATVGSGEMSFSGGSPVIREVADPHDPDLQLWLMCCPRESARLRHGDKQGFTGRLLPGVMPVDGPVSDWWPCLDVTGGRWHGASVAGLVVGAFGTLVFALYLRRWQAGNGDTLRVSSDWSPSAAGSSLQSLEPLARPQGVPAR